MRKFTISYELFVVVWVLLTFPSIIKKLFRLSEQLIYCPFTDWFVVILCHGNIHPESAQIVWFYRKKYYNLFSVVIGSMPNKVVKLLTKTWRSGLILVSTFSSFIPIIAKDKNANTTCNSTRQTANSYRFYLFWNKGWYLMFNLFQIMSIWFFELIRGVSPQL